MNPPKRSVCVLSRKRYGVSVSVSVSLRLSLPVCASIVERAECACAPECLCFSGQASVVSQWCHDSYTGVPPVATRHAAMETLDKCQQTIMQ